MILAVLILALAACALAACANPAAEQARRARLDGQVTVAADAIFYWQCMRRPVVVVAECRPWSDAYKRDAAAFKAKYGDPSER
jgi:hypothetical protein